MNNHVKTILTMVGIAIFCILTYFFVLFAFGVFIVVMLGFIYFMIYRLYSNDFDYDEYP
jgi:hypothetical protein